MSAILLINLSGENQAGITSRVSALLAEHELNILDIDQAVLHNEFSMVIMSRLTSETDVDQLLESVSAKIRSMGIEVRARVLSQQEITNWQAEQHAPGYIVTLLARRITTSHISRVTATTARFGLNIDKIRRLSGDLGVAAHPAECRACVEFSVRGNPADLTELRKTLLELSAELDVDVAFQEDDIYRRNRRLVVFDMDSTLIEAEVIDELAKCAGVGEQVSAITESAMRGELDFKQSFARRVALLEGLDEAVLSRVAQSLKVTEGAERLISSLRHLGYKTAILSGGFNYFGRYVQSLLGMDYVYANELEIADGKVTGRVTGEVVDGARKAQLLEEIAAREGVTLQQVIAVGDGANDLPMLSLAGLGIAFRAKPLVKASAKQSISSLGLDSILYLMGFSDEDIQQLASS